jgi:hypothetical protein
MVRSFCRAISCECDSTRLFYFGMTQLTRFGFRLFVTAQFLLTAIGVPLYQHVCSATGTHAPFSVCPMHQTANADTGCTDAMANADDCCAMDDEMAFPASTSIDQSGAGGAHCCADVDVSPVVKDSFCGSSHVTPSLCLWSCAFPSASANPLPIFSGTSAGVFCDSSPPSRSEIRLFLSSLLI